MAIKKITQKKQIVPLQKTNQVKPQNPQARAIYDQIMRNQMANYAAQGGGIGGLSPQEAGITPEQLAKLNSLQNQYGENYTQGRLMGAPVGSIGGMPTPPPGGGLGGLTADEANISPEQRKILESEMTKMKADIAAREIERQNMMKAGAFAPIGGTPDRPIYGTIGGPVYADGSPAPGAQSLNQQDAENFKRQFAQYAQLLSGGIAQNNAMNQDAATNFGSMEPGQDATQPAKTSTARPQVPIPGIGMQQTAPQKQQRNILPQGFQKFKYF